jgi:hypothetical protein
MLDSSSISFSSAVFLIGSVRSGTTLLRLMLDHHPRIAWSNEFEYAVDLIPDAGGWPDLQAYYDWLETHRIFLATGFEIARNLSYPDLIKSFLEQKRKRGGKVLVGATVHHHFDRLLGIWPDARFIHLLRDGRDVARSCIPMGWAGNMWTAPDPWIKAELLWDRLYQSLPADRWMTLTYENLITDPTTQLTRVCQFIGESFDPQMLEYHRHTTYERPDPKLIGQWKRKLSEYEIRLVESRIAPMLAQRGYQLSGLPPLEVTPAMQRQLRRQDRWSRAKFRFERYGPWLFGVDFLSRRLRIRPWYKSVRLRLNEIDKTHLK